MGGLDVSIWDIHGKYILNQIVNKRKVEVPES